MWSGATGQDGYARFRFGGRGSKTGVAHRFAYEFLAEEVSDGLQLDHLCRVRNCANPNHLEPVTPRENTLRGNTLAAANAAKTHCPAGHPYDFKNTYVDATRGIRMCRACAAERTRNRRKNEREVS
ncbi:hypothetical protein BMW22_15850 [Rhizobium leguminosarum]|uniref:HNH nuclease domain-containing protein n=1 Tax=Rhizobium leguminosarum TaxID=384 RepID=A0A1L3ZGY9_RHILE|nr:hypothetical protein BMW22_15850 [Rhizobium leguminosarum]